MFRKGFSCAATALGLAVVVVIGACTGTDPEIDSSREPDGGATTPDGSSSGGEDTGAADTGVDADLPPKAEGKFQWASAYSTASLIASVAAAGDAVILA